MIQLTKYLFVLHSNVTYFCTFKIIFLKFNLQYIFKFNNSQKIKLRSESFFECNDSLFSNFY